MLFPNSKFQYVNCWFIYCQLLGRAFLKRSGFPSALCTIFMILLTFFGKFCNAHMLHALGVYYSYIIQEGHTQLLAPRYQFLERMQGVFWVQKGWIYRNVSRIMKIVHCASASFSFFVGFFFWKFSSIKRDCIFSFFLIR